MDARTTTADATTIEREVRIAARPETVFPYFTDPERMRRWMGRTISLDARPGGALRIDYNGEDIVGGTGTEGELDCWGGPFGITKGLIAEFGPERVRDAPISETAIIGAAAGAALTGLRPVAELMFSDFFGVCFDQLYNQAAKFRYMFGGKARTPMVVRTTYGAGSRSASQHSQSPYAIFTHVPGLKVVMPTNAYDAKGCMIAAIRDGERDLPSTAF